MTTQTDVETALLTYLSSTLLPNFPGLQAVFALEKASKLYAQNIPFLLCTLHNHDVVTQGGEHEWQFMLQMSTSKFGGAQAALDTVQTADRGLVDAVNKAINEDAGYIALRSLGLYTAECKSLPYGQQSPQQINPHIVSCRTFPS